MFLFSGVFVPCLLAFPLQLERSCEPNSQHHINVFRGVDIRDFFVLCHCHLGTKMIGYNHRGPRCARLIVLHHGGGHQHDLCVLCVVFIQSRYRCSSVSAKSYIVFVADWFGCAPRLAPICLMARLHPHFTCHRLMHAISYRDGKHWHVVGNNSIFHTSFVRGTAANKYHFCPRRITLALAGIGTSFSV